MNKENTLFTIIGLFVGLILGFMFANSYLRNVVTTGPSTTSAMSTMDSNSNMPPGHPDVANSDIVPEEVQPLLDLAKNSPNSFEAQIKAADALLEAEMYKKSLEFLKVANKLKPDDYDTLVKLGNGSFDSGDFIEAEKWYSVALAKNKDDNNVRTDLGLTFIFRENGNVDRALQEFNTVLAANPNHIQALQNSIVAYIRKGDKIKAQENLSRFETLSPDSKSVPRFKDQISKMGTN